jgi:hypothetical protein
MRPGHVEGHQREPLRSRASHSGVQLQRDPDRRLSRVREVPAPHLGRVRLCPVSQRAPLARSCVATATGRVPGAVNSWSRNVPTRYPCRLIVNM